MRYRGTIFIWAIARLEPRQVGKTFKKNGGTMKKKIMYPSIIALLTLLLLPALEGQIKKKADRDDRLSYFVSVNAQLVPIYAVDKKGNPVFDLKKEEIQLYANEKPVEIIYFYGCSVTEQEQVPGHCHGDYQKRSPHRLLYHHGE